MYQHHIDNLRDFFNALTGNKPVASEPTKGMSWHIHQHRAYPHYARGYVDGLAHIQIVSVDEKNIEYLYNSSLRTMPRSDWPDYYENNLRRARSAGKRLGGGSIVPKYFGIQEVHEEFVDMLRNPQPPALFY